MRQVVIHPGEGGSWVATTRVFPAVWRRARHAKKRYRKPYRWRIQTRPGNWVCYAVPSSPLVPPRSRWPSMKPSRKTPKKSPKAVHVRMIVG